MKKIILIFTLGLSLSACNSVTPQPPPADPDADMASYIDQGSVYGSQRTDIAAVLRSLPDEIRNVANVGVVLVNPQNQISISNRTDIISAVAFLPGDSLKTASLKPVQAVHTLGSVAHPCVVEGSGSFWRDYTPPDRFTELKGTIDVPPDWNVSDFEKSVPSGDTSYIYTGGWGGSAIGEGAPLDAGLKHNVANANWEPFFKYKGGSVIVATDNRLAPPKAIHRVVFKGGQAINLDFSVTRDPRSGRTFVNLYTGGYNKDNIYAALVISLETTNGANSLPGWDPFQTTLVLKRMVSIAQTEAYIAANAPGKNYWPSGAFMLNARWRDVKVGSGAYPASTPYPYSTSRACLADSAAVGYNLSDAPDITVSIQIPKYIKQSLNLTK